MSLPSNQTDWSAVYPMFGLVIIPVGRRRVFYGVGRGLTCFPMCANKGVLAMWELQTGHQHTIGRIGGHIGPCRLEKETRGYFADKAPGQGGSYFFCLGITVGD